MVDLATIVFVTMGVVVTAVATLFACYGIGVTIYYIVWRIQDKTAEIKRRHERRFFWYYRVGLLESSWMVEPNVAKDFRWSFTPWAK